MFKVKNKDVSSFSIVNFEQVNVGWESIIHCKKQAMKRSSRPQVFCKKAVLRNFAYSQEKACNFIKKETLAQVFSVNFAIFLRTPFLTEHQ